MREVTMMGNDIGMRLELKRWLKDECRCSASFVRRSFIETRQRQHEKDSPFLLPCYQVIHLCMHSTENVRCHQCGMHLGHGTSIKMLCGAM